MTCLIAIDRWLHRVMRGRCWNRRLCERLSFYEATRDRSRAGAHRREGPGAPPVEGNE